MSGSERRKEIIKILSSEGKAVSGKALANWLEVSRQVIVQDIALLRANGTSILSTNNGYVMPKQKEISRVFKMHHTDEQVEDEMQTIVDYGGSMVDVFVYHKVYGILKAPMNIHSRLDIEAFVEELKTGKSSLLKNITSDYHYHTVSARSEQMLDVIQEKLQEKGFLAQLRDYEPINFWERETS